MLLPRSEQCSLLLFVCLQSLQQPDGKTSSPATRSHFSYIRIVLLLASTEVNFFSRYSHCPQKTRQLQKPVLAVEWLKPDFKHSRFLVQPPDSLTESPQFHFPLFLIVSLFCKSKSVLIAILRGDADSDVTTICNSATQSINLRIAISWGPYCRTLAWPSGPVFRYSRPPTAFHRYTLGCVGVVA